MKQPKRLTRKQKECLSTQDMDVTEWAFIAEEDFYYKVVSKKTGAIKYVDKFISEKR